ncbi:MAG TPA: hypothetical protein VEX62_11090 [Candidatus Limnocylindrales bacterium]|nr:hypothetical protein [Candidatus Limnocylindrales bacterium]
MRLARRVVASVIMATLVLGVALPSAAAAEWSGRYSVYTQGSFSQQYTNYTCVGASVQMMLNMIEGRTDHSASAQKSYWRYGRNHGRYQPNNNGVDPVGWVAALEHFGAGNYAINLATQYQPGLRQLAKRLRAEGRPIGLFVHHGGHAWVMTGFEATADPNDTNDFKVTAVQVMGPLYPDGTIGGRRYDPGPRTWLTAKQLKKKFTPLEWGQAPEWSGRWVAVVPT